MLCITNNVYSRKSRGQNTGLQKVGGTCPPVHLWIYVHDYCNDCTNDCLYKRNSLAALCNKWITVFTACLQFDANQFHAYKSHEFESCSSFHPWENWYTGIHCNYYQVLVCKYLKIHTLINWFRENAEIKQDNSLPPDMQYLLWCRNRMQATIQDIKFTPSRNVFICRDFVSWPYNKCTQSVRLEKMPEKNKSHATKPEKYRLSSQASYFYLNIIILSSILGLFPNTARNM